MTTVVVASTNPVKVQAAVNGLRRMFPAADLDVVTVAVPSGVGHQPFSDEETLLGALNRVQQAAALAPEADYWIGIEGGVQEVEGDMAAFAWIVVRSKRIVGKSRTGTFFLPRAVADLVRQGKELGEADDIVFNRFNSKQENGAVGILTGNVVERMHLYEQAVILALIPFKNETLYTT
jgi:inosine/xanthosine triphosphatase